MALQANRQKQWQRIVEAGLCPGITDFETYEAKATEQLELAYRAITGRSIAVPSPVDAAAIHAIIFEGIHPWAGEFRKMGETVRFDRGVVGLDAHRIIPELERIARSLPPSCRTPAKSLRPPRFFRWTLNPPG